MNQNTYQPRRPPPTWYQPLPPNAPPSSSFWTNPNFNDHLKELQDTVNLAQSMKKELEMLIEAKESNKQSGSELLELLNNRSVYLGAQEMCSIKAASGLMSKLRALLEPFRVVVDEKCPWEEKSVVLRLAEKLKKSKRNKLWRKRKRKRVAEALKKERDKFEEVDHKVDEWRAREIAKDIAQQKVEKMKEIAKQKAKVERKRLEAELEMVLVVEKLQELRSIRIEKLKKQGNFIPEEDDKFLERVRVAVEEEERQVRAAADTEAAKGAIASAEESRKNINGLGSDSRYQDSIGDDEEGQKQVPQVSGEEVQTVEVADMDAGQDGHVESGYGKYDYVSSLPLEFYHYYHGSNTDLGTLIEVRRIWDAYIRPGGSRIPGHWIQPPPPADEVWASYLVHPRPK